MDVRKLCDEIKPTLDKYKDEEYIELEFRLGKFNSSFFDTNIGKENFYKCLDGLQKYNGWEKVVQSKTEVYYREDDNKRLTVDEITGDDTLIIKNKVYTQDFKHLQNVPYDIRLGVSKETPAEEDDNNEWNKKKNKNRMSFIRKNLSIDMTICDGEVEDMDAEDSKVYQVEFEIIDPKKVEDIDTLFKIIHKINDFFNMSNYIC
jgi:hypothetical protein